jgi:hypothetical protein
VRHLTHMLLSGFSCIATIRKPAPQEHLRFVPGLSFRPKKKRRYSNNWVFSIYNLYSHFNPYFYYYDQQGSAVNGTLTATAKQVSLFPVISSVNWNLK